MRARLFISALAVALYMPAAHATSVTLYLSGTFTDGAPLGGSITIDNTAGTVTAYNVTVGAPDTGTYTVSQGNSTPGGFYFNVGIGTAAGAYPSLSLTLATSTLVGYTGGPICNLQATCNGVVAGIYRSAGAQAIQLGSGNVSTTPSSPATPVSAPALSPVALCALAMLLAVSGAAFNFTRKRSV